MATYTVTTSADEDAAIAYLAEQAGQTDPAAFFDAQVHNMLNGWVITQHTAMAPATPMDVSNAYAAAPLDQQQQVVSILNVPLKEQPA